jgi:hypothetical protein
VLRFPVSTASFALRGDGHTVALRAKSYGSFLLLLPHALRHRYRVRHRATVDDAELTAKMVPDPNW